MIRGREKDSEMKSFNMNRQLRGCKGFVVVSSSTTSANTDMSDLRAATNVTVAVPLS